MEIDEEVQNVIRSLNALKKYYMTEVVKKSFEQSKIAGEEYTNMLEYFTESMSNTIDEIIMKLEEENNPENAKKLFKRYVELGLMAVNQSIENAFTGSKCDICDGEKFTCIQLLTNAKKAANDWKNVCKECRDKAFIKPTTHELNSPPLKLGESTLSDFDTYAKAFYPREFEVYTKNKDDAE